MKTTLTRPAPTGETTRGKWTYKTYDLAAVAAYRKSRGVTQAELAHYLHIGQSYVSQVENTDRPETIHESTVTEWLDAVDFMAERRAKMVADGVAQAAEIRAGTYARPYNGRGLRTRAETDAIIQRQREGLE